MPPRPKNPRSEPLVQTTVRFPRSLLKRARMRALTDDTTLQALLITALDTELTRRERTEARRQARHADRPVTVRG